MAMPINQARMLMELAVRNQHTVHVWYVDGSQAWVHYYKDGGHAWHVSSDLFSTIKYYKGVDEILDGVCQVIVSYIGGGHRVVEVRHVPPDM